MHLVIAVDVIPQYATSDARDLDVVRLNMLFWSGYVQCILHLFRN